MKLIKLEVENWRGLSKSSIDFAEGITVIGGPNESGKTSLRGALRAALLLPQGVRNEKKMLESNRPWDTSLCPKVKLELEVGGKSCIVVKQFLKKRDHSNLTVNGRLIAEDDSVQPALLDLLGDSAEWIDVLWGEQGEARLDLPTPESVKGKLASAAQDTVMPEVVELERLIQENYSEFWTEAKGLPNKRFQTARNAAMEAEGIVDGLKKLIAEADQRAADLALKTKRLELLREKHTKLSANWKAGQQSLSAWETYQRTQTETKLVNAQISALETWKQKLQKLCAELNRLCVERDTWQQKIEPLRAITEKQPARKEIDDLVSQQKYLELLIAYEEHQRILSVPTPTQNEIRTLADLEEELRMINARLKAGQLEAELVAERQLDAVLRNDSAESNIQLDAGAQQSWSTEQSFELSIPGVAKLRVTSGSASVKDDIERRAIINKQIDEALVKWQVTSVAELSDRTKEQNFKLQSCKKVTDTELKNARAKIQDATAIETLSREHKSERLCLLPSDIQAAELAWSESNARYQTALTEYKSLSEKNPLLELQSLTKSLSALWREIHETDLAIPEMVTPPWVTSVQSDTKTADARLAAHKTKLDELNSTAKRPEGEEVTKENLDKMEREVSALNAEVESLSTHINQAIGNIAAQGDLYSRLVTAEENKSKAELEEQRVTTEAMAARELLLAFQEAKAKLQKDVVAPLQDLVTERFKQLTSGAYKTVRFDSTLKLDGVATTTFDGVGLDAISFGTREQLLLLTRLGLAELVSREERQVVILDDNLVHTDEKRMRLACEMLEQASTSVQIIIFTCHPERYASIAKGAQVSVAPLVNV